MKITWSKALKLIDQFLNQRRNELDKIDFVVGVSRGGLIPATIIATATDKPLVTVYIDKQDRVYIDRGKWLKGQRILLIDDIVRTGKTFSKMYDLVLKQEPKSIKSFTLFCQRGASRKPTWSELIMTDRSFPWDI
jgi:adenine/guanine phosphoribosyltransferase-like PRPP-binding protein